MDQVTVCDLLQRDDKLENRAVLVAELAGDTTPTYPETHIGILKQENEKAVSAQNDGYLSDSD